MKINQTTNILYSIILCFDALSRYGVVALKTASGQASAPKLQPAVLLDSGVASAGAADARNDGSRALAGRRSMRYLIALQTWHRMNRAGIQCPKPEPCECHCDCPNTEIKPPPPSPTLCPPQLNAWPAAPPPTTTTIATTTPAPGPEPRECSHDEVKMSDGACAKITYNAIVELGHLVDSKKDVLAHVQASYDEAYRGANCVQCPGALKYFAIRPELIKAHQQYFAALRMYLFGLGAYEKIVADARAKAEASVNETEKEEILGPEFALGKLKRTPHCETWTANASDGTGATNDMCGIICRLQPSCVGFAIEPKSKWCVWYDESKPQANAACSTHSETEYVKKRQGPLNAPLWSAIDKVRMFEKAVQEVLTVAHTKMEVASESWSSLANADKTNPTLLKEQKELLRASLQNYSNTAYDAQMINKQLDIVRTQAFAMAIAEVEKTPPFKRKPLPPSQKERVKEFKAPAPEGFQVPSEDPPKILKWKDFPNSQDTKWSQMHPDCPQGVPCFCDCKCRGAPPQNFVEPPPPAYVPPCPPPPPLPNPAIMSSVLSSMAQAQSAGTLSISVH